MAKILVIGNNPNNLISLKANINKFFPYAVVLSSLNGPEGISLAKANNPDLILLDNLMTGMDSFELCRLLKLEEQVNDIPVVFLTTIQGERENRIKALEVGAEGFLSNPIDEIELIAQIRAMLRIKEAEDRKVGEKERLRKLVDERTEALQKELKERKLAEKALRDSEEKYRRMVDFLPDAVVIHSNGKIVFANAAALKTVGADSFEQFVERPLIDYVHEDYRSGSLNRIKEIYATGQASKFSEEKFYTLKNEIIEVEVVGIPVTFMGKPAIQTIIRDITERKKAEEQLKNSEERFRTIFENSTIGIYRTSPEGEILMANPTLVKMLGYESFEELKKRDLEKDYFEPDYQRSKFREKIESEGEIIGLETGWKRIDNTLLYVSESAKVIRDSNGRIIYYEGTVEDITKRKLAEESLRQSNEFNKSLLQTIPFGMDIVDEHGDVLFQSENFENVFGKKAIGSKCWELYRDDKQACKDCPLNKGITIGDTDVYLTAGVLGGRIFEISHTGMMFNGQKAMLEIFQDVTERKKSEVELIERNRFIQTVLDNLPIGVALNTINEGTATYMNRKFEEIYGWTSDEITSISTFFEHVYPDPAYRSKLIDQIMIDIQSGDPKRMHWENIFVTRKDGSKRVINAVNIPLFDQNTMVSTVSDITDLHKSQNDLLVAKEKAEESDRLKSAFLANMSHEIRTPLNSIIGFSELLADPEFDSDQHVEFAQMINSSGNSLLAIISDIMDLSKIEAGQIQVSKSRFMVNQLISDLQREFSLDALEKGIELKLDPTSPKDEIILEGDQNRIKQVLVNLIGNSLKFTAKGYIEIGFVIVEDFIQFHVMDTGIGIAEEFHEYVFERFRQVDSSFSRKYGGNGLGLAISKSLVDMLGGKIWMESAPGVGSTFYFTVPGKLIQSINKQFLL